MSHSETSKFFIRSLINTYSLCLRKRQRNFDPNQKLHVINHTGLGDTLFTGPALQLLSQHLPFVHHVNPGLQSFVSSWKIPGQNEVRGMAKNSLKDYKYFKNQQVLVLRSNFITIPILRAMNANFIASSDEFDYSKLADISLQSNTAGHYFLEHLLKIENLLKLSPQPHLKIFNDFKSSIPTHEIPLPFKPHIVVHMGGVTTRNMRHLEFKQALLMLKKNYNILQLGSADEVDPQFPSILNLTLNQVAFVLQSGSVFIGTNSGVAQLARFFSPKVFMLMARTSHLRTGNFHDHSTFKTLGAFELPCYPCQAFKSDCYYHQKEACLKTPSAKKIAELMEKEINISYH